MKKNIKEALFLFSAESALLIQDSDSKTGLAVKQSDTVQAIETVYYLMHRFEVSQRNALSLLELIAKELNWNIKIPSQATLSRRMPKESNKLPVIWRNLVIGDDNELKSVRETPKNNASVQYQSYSITAELTESHVFFREGEVKYLRLKQLSDEPQQIYSIHKTKNPKLLNVWLSNNQDLITPLSSLFQLTPAKLFDSLIPLFPRLAVNGDELLEDIFDEYEKNKKKNELISELLRPERPEKYSTFSTIGCAYSALLVDIDFINPKEEPDRINLLLLRCNRTKLNFMGYFDEFIQLLDYAKFSININRQKKTVRVKISANHDDKAIDSLNISFPHLCDTDTEGNEEDQKWKSFASDLDFKSDIGLVKNASTAHPIVQLHLSDTEIMTRESVLKRIHQWLIWNNNKAKLNDSDVDFFFGEMEQGLVFSYDKNEDVLATVIHSTDKEMPFMRKIKYADE